jgi:hypothetical protein
MSNPGPTPFEKRSTEGFEAALTPDVVLNASSLVKPIVGRDLVKINTGTASSMYEHLTFLAQAKSDGRTWLQWKARTFSGIESPGSRSWRSTRKITSIGIHQRPLNVLLKFSAELVGNSMTSIDYLTNNSQAVCRSAERIAARSSLPGSRSCFAIR